ncbi:MAG: nucleotidyltransferase [Thiogranum sp.]|nr:nucleotidyltransferase [Thiogranum sp.]
MDRQVSVSPFENPLDLLLADVAIRVQLSPTQHGLAVERYEAIAEWLDRPDSCLHDQIERFYPQGGMAIGATIASAAKNDEFDIDLIAQLALPAQVPPDQALDLTFRAIKGNPGSRYYKKTLRNTRCVTIQYNDMHLDVTPAVLLPARHPRTSVIFPSKLEEPRSRDQHIIANPYGFSAWFTDRTPVDRSFGAYFAKRSTELDQFFKAQADTEDVPPPSPAHHKSVAVVALQLIKRFRNIRYDAREGRMPPSVLLAKLVGDSTSGSQQLSLELVYQVDKLRQQLTECDEQGLLIHEVNPTCQDDILTDRWPSSRSDQRLFIADLEHFARQLARLTRGPDLAETQTVLEDLFGEHPARDVIARLNEDVGRAIAGGNAAQRRDSGRIEIASVISAESAILSGHQSHTSPRHTFFGDSHS